jgi:hypothetical protein
VIARRGYGVSVVESANEKSLKAVQRILVRIEPQTLTLTVSRFAGAGTRSSEPLRRCPLYREAGEVWVRVLYSVYRD